MYITHTVCINVQSLIVEIKTNSILFCNSLTVQHISPWPWSLLELPCLLHTWDRESLGMVWIFLQYFFHLEFWIDIVLWLFALLRSLFFWDVVLHHWVIDAQCFEITILSQNFRHQLPSDMASHPSRMKTSTSPPWKCKNLHIFRVAYCGDLYSWINIMLLIVLLLHAVETYLFLSFCQQMEGKCWKCWSPLWLLFRKWHLHVLASPYH
jgi:hypothetical protein